MSSFRSQFVSLPSKDFSGQLSQTRAETVMGRTMRLHNDAYTFVPFSLFLSLNLKLMPVPQKWDPEITRSPYMFYVG